MKAIETALRIGNGMKQKLVIAAVLVACLAAGVGVPPWLLARPGAIVFTSAGDRDSATTPVCPTAAAYRDYANAGGANGCLEHGMGIRVIIDDVIPRTRAFGAIAKIHAQNGAFHGYTAVAQLLPGIPHGVAVTLEPAAHETLTISNDQSSELGQGLHLGIRASATTVRFDPANSNKRDLLVRVTSGKYNRRQGWLFARQAFVDKLPLDTLVLL